MPIIPLAIALALVPNVSRAADQPGAFRGTAAYCYFNEKTLTWRIGNDAVERTIHFDRDAGALRTVKIDVKEGHAKVAPGASGEGEFTVADTAGARSSISLSRGWSYLWQSVLTPAQGGRQLTVHLYGVGLNKGYEAEAIYQVYPGNRPYLAKSLTLINRTGGPRTIVDVTVDRLILTSTAVRIRKGEPPVAAPADFKAGADGSATLTSSDSRGGIVAAVVGGGAVTAQSGVLTERVVVNQTIPDDGGRYNSRLAVAAPYTGASQAGMTLYQRFVAAYPPIPPKYTPITNR